MTPWFWFWIGISFAAGLNAGVILMAVLAMARDLPHPRRRRAGPGGATLRPLGVQGMTTPYPLTDPARAWLRDQYPPARTDPDALGHLLRHAHRIAQALGAPVVDVPHLRQAAAERAQEATR